jgi:chromate transport protein ChrA
VVLELLHGFKVQAYLAVSNESRRLMWTLAHAHGVLLAVINIILASRLDAGRLSTRNISRVSIALLVASLLLPADFSQPVSLFTRAILVLAWSSWPVGAVLLLIALFTIACEQGRPERT